MNAVPTPDTILAISEDTEAPPSFVEKDWYNVQLMMRILACFQPTPITVVFTGGTCLFKGYGLIKRFSEDLDFILTPDQPLTRTEKRSYRDNLIAYIEADNRFRIDRDKIEKANRSNFFSLPVKYDIAFPSADPLRDYLKIEMRFDGNALPLATYPIASLVNQASNLDPETEITCRSPLEIASGKVSALCHQTINRHKNPDRPHDKPTIRHLHDLAALSHLLHDDMDNFTTLTQTAMSTDLRGWQDSTATPRTLLADTLNILSTGKNYKQEYTNYVEFMGFAPESETIPFDQALARFTAIANPLLKKLT